MGHRTGPTISLIPGPEYGSVCLISKTTREKRVQKKDLPFCYQYHL